MPIEWQLVQPISWETFDNVRDSVSGEVVWYDPYKGELDFNKEECGFLDLRTRNGEIKRVKLDRPALNDKVRDAHPRPGDLIGIRFVEEKRSEKGKSASGQPYKVFNVMRGVGGVE